MVICMVKVWVLYLGQLGTLKAGSANLKWKHHVDSRQKHPTLAVTATQPTTLNATVVPRRAYYPQLLPVFRASSLSVEPPYTTTRCVVNRVGREGGGWLRTHPTSHHSAQRTAQGAPRR